MVAAALPIIIQAAVPLAAAAANTPSQLTSLSALARLSRLLLVRVGQAAVVVLVLALMAATLVSIAGLFSPRAARVALILMVLPVLRVEQAGPAERYLMVVLVVRLQLDFLLAAAAAAVPTGPVLGLAILQGVALVRLAAAVMAAAEMVLIPLALVALTAVLHKMEPQAVQVEHLQPVIRARMAPAAAARG